MKPVYMKTYRGKNAGVEYALRTTSLTRRLRKTELYAFLRQHFPQAAPYRVRIANNYRKGSVALIRAKGALWK